MVKESAHVGGKLVVFNFILMAIPCLATGTAPKKESSAFGGDFSAGALSGAEAPGPSAATMGSQAASAMNIGTGGMGPGDYTSSYKTPNYTQYTQQDFKEFMPNYQDMMETSLGAGKSSFGNFSEVSTMLKGFMELQKEQLKVEKAKAEADKAKLELELDYDFDSSEPTAQGEEAIKSKEIPSRRIKRSFLGSTNPSNIFLSPPPKIQYPLAGKMQMKPLGLLDSPPPSRPLSHFIFSTPATTLPSSDEKSSDDENEKKIIEEKILETLTLLLNQRKPPAGTEQTTEFPKTEPGYSSVSSIPVVGDRLNGVSLQDTLMNLGGKMVSALRPRMARQSNSGGWDSSSASKWMNGGGSSWSSGSGMGGQKSRQTGGQQATAPASPTTYPSTSSASASGGPPPSFWEKFSSMFGQAPAQGSDPQAGGFASGSSQASATPQSATSGSQAPSPTWAYPPPAMPDQASSGSQSNQRKRSIADYGPLHGGVSLSNIPYTADSLYQSAADPAPASQIVPDNPNIPSLSFSINPQKPAPAPKRMSSIPDLTPPADPRFILTQRPPQPAPLVLNYPPRVEIARPDVQPYVYVDASGNPVVPKDPVVYLVDPFHTSYQGMSTGTAVYRSSRDINEKDPLLVYEWKKKNNQLKKVLLDANDGLLVETDSSTGPLRRKRSTGDGDTPTEPTTKESESKNQDPNGHSHSENDQLKMDEFFPTRFLDNAEIRRDSYQAQTSGGSVDYDFDRVQTEGSVDKRSVKVDLAQKTGALPDGTIETISAGGGRAPGHHEGGGLTVEVTKPEEEVEKKKQERKTLNFFFTW